MGPERDNLSASVVMLKNRAEIGSLLCQTVGTPLTHPDAMAIALATNEKLLPRGGLALDPHRQQRWG